MGSTADLAGMGGGGEGGLASRGSTGSLQGAASMSSADEPLPIVRTYPCLATAVTSVCSVRIFGTSSKSSVCLNATPPAFSNGRRDCLHGRAPTATRPWV